MVVAFLVGALTPPDEGGEFRRVQGKLGRSMVALAFFLARSALIAAV